MQEEKTSNKLQLKLRYGQSIAHTQLYWNICAVNCTYIGVRGHFRKKKNIREYHDFIEVRQSKNINGFKHNDI